MEGHLKLRLQSLNMIIERQHRSYLKIILENVAPPKNYAKSRLTFSLYIYTLLVWVFVSLYLINIGTNQAQILCKTSHVPREGLWNIKIEEKNPEK